MYIKLNNRIYSYTVNANFIFICIELSEIRNMIIYCKDTLKFSLSQVVYHYFLKYTFLPVHSF